MLLLISYRTNKIQTTIEYPTNTTSGSTIDNSYTPLIKNDQPKVSYTTVERTIVPEEVSY